MQLISKYNRGIRYLLCAIDLFSKYAFAVPLKDEKGVTNTNAFQSILDKSESKPNKIWTDQSSESYNNGILQQFISQQFISMLFPCANITKAILVVELSTKWVYTGLDKILQVFSIFIFWSNSSFSFFLVKLVGTFIFVSKVT